MPSMLVVAPDPHLAPRLDEATPPPFARTLEEQQLDRATVGETPRVDDARIVQNHEVAGLQKRPNLDERPVLDRAARAMQHHHPRVFTTRERPLRDQLLRQRIIVIGQPRAHAAV
jgi:hypothetical protein